MPGCLLVFKLSLVLSSYSAFKPQDVTSINMCICICICKHSVKVSYRIVDHRNVRGTITDARAALMSTSRRRWWRCLEHRSASSRKLATSSALGETTASDRNTKTACRIAKQQMINSYLRQFQKEKIEQKQHKSALLTLILWQLSVESLIPKKNSLVQFQLSVRYSIYTLRNWTVPDWLK